MRKELRAEPRGPYTEGMKKEGGTRMGQSCLQAQMEMGCCKWRRRQAKRNGKELRLSFSLLEVGCREILLCKGSRR